MRSGECGNPELHATEYGDASRRRKLCGHDCNRLDGLLSGANRAGKCGQRTIERSRTFRGTCEPSGAILDRESDCGRGDAGADYLWRSASSERETRTGSVVLFDTPRMRRRAASVLQESS